VQIDPRYVTNDKLTEKIRLKTIEIDLPKGTEVKKYFENDGVTLY